MLRAMTPSRSQFLQTLAATGAAVALAPRSARATDSRIDVMLDEPIGTIAPELYGHFAEHLGGVVYDGIWVGENSAVPNDFGIRRAHELLGQHQGAAQPVAVRPESFRHGRVRALLPALRGAAVHRRQHPQPS